MTYSGNWREQHASKLANAKKPKDVDMAIKAQRRARKVEWQFRLKHGMTSIQHLAEVMKFQNEVFDDCDCFACIKARYQPPVIKIRYCIGDN